MVPDMAYPPAPVIVIVQTLSALLMGRLFPWQAARRGHDHAAVLRLLPQSAPVHLLSTNTASSRPGWQRDRHIGSERNWLMRLCIRPGLRRTGGEILMMVATGIVVKDGTPIRLSRICKQNGDILRPRRKRAKSQSGERAA